MFKHDRIRGLRPRGRTLAALTIASTTLAPALAPVEAHAQATAAGAPVQAATLKVKAQHNVLAGHKASIDGALSSHAAGVPVVVETPKGSGWHEVARTKTKAGGRFASAWRPRRPGAFKVRVRALAPGTAPWNVSGRVQAYRQAMASFYGPGLYGSALACGGTLSPSKLGVANKTLPCGTKVTLRYRGRSVTVPVIDRGPYVAGREYDLTSATKAKLGFGSTGVLWATK